MMCISAVDNMVDSIQISNVEELKTSKKYYSQRSLKVQKIGDSFLPHLSVDETEIEKIKLQRALSVK